MTENMYRFTKDGKRYTAFGKNRLEAQWDAELAFGVDLRGAEYEDICKLRVVRRGIVK